MKKLVLFTLTLAAYQQQGSKCECEQYELRHFFISSII